MPVKTKAKAHKQLLEEDQSSAGAQICGLIAEAMKIEEQQYVHRRCLPALADLQSQGHLERTH